jgi:hypothetical protein
MDITQDKEIADFATKAAVAFSKNPAIYTWAISDPQAGHLLAIRWNSSHVMVVKLDPDMSPRLYSTWEMIACELPPIHRPYEP